MKNEEEERGGREEGDEVDVGKEEGRRELGVYILDLALALAAFAPSNSVDTRESECSEQ